MKTFIMKFAVLTLTFFAIFSFASANISNNVRLVGADEDSTVYMRMWWFNSKENALNYTPPEKRISFTSIDTLIINDRIIKLASISEEEFKKFKPDKCEDKDNDDLHKVYFWNVSREQILTFKTENGKVLKLIDSSFDMDSDGGYAYHYEGGYEYMDYWQVYTDIYEDISYDMIDRNDGTQIWFWGEPSISKDKKYIISFASPYIYPEKEGLQIFVIKDRKVYPIFERNTGEQGRSPNIVVNDVIWKNNATIYIEFIVETSMYPEKRYRELMIDKL